LPRVVLVLETEEESGSPNLISLLDEAADLIGKVDYCFCMDSGALDYEQLWMTSSLSGIVIVSLSVEGGNIPETFRIIRALLDRIDDPKTGKVASEF
jgi:acetylornithine deacetylase/succinyl-diaminopimelate desuccinylase-like protein